MSKGETSHKFLAPCALMKLGDSTHTTVIWILTWQVMASKFRHLTWNRKSAEADAFIVEDSFESAMLTRSQGETFLHGRFPKRLRTFFRVLIKGYVIYIYIYYPPETHILYDFTAKNTVSCCFCSRCETCPHRPRFRITPPAGKVLVQVLFLLRPLLSACVSVFIIRIVISIVIIHKHDCYHCHCPCHDQYQYHHTYCKMNNVTITMILVLLLAFCYYYQV